MCVGVGVGVGVGVRVSVSVSVSVRVSVSVSVRGHSGWSWSPQKTGCSPTPLSEPVDNAVGVLRLPKGSFGGFAVSALLREALPQRSDSSGATRPPLTPNASRWLLAGL